MMLRKFSGRALMNFQQPLQRVCRNPFNPFKCGSFLNLRFLSNEALLDIFEGTTPGSKRKETTTEGGLLIKKNWSEKRRNPDYERKARLMTEEISIPELEELSFTDWFHGFHRRAAENCLKFLDLPSFEAHIKFIVKYPNLENKLEHYQHKVYYGNIIEPKTASVEPTFIIQHRTRHIFNAEKYYSVVLWTPDGCLEENSDFQVHWSVLNIPFAEGKQDIVFSGETPVGEKVTSYFQPLPIKNAGLHRYAFYLIAHENKITQDEHSFLHCGPFPLSQLSSALPVGACTFQTEWDSTVSDAFKHRWSREEPVAFRESIVCRAPFKKR